MRSPLRHLVTCLTLAFALAPSPSARAQEIPSEYLRFFAQRADQRSRFEKALNLIGKTGFPVGRSFALIGGVTKYPNFPPVERSLKPAAVDIEKLQAYLKEQEFFDEIVVLKDGDMTLSNLNYFLENYFPERLADSPHSRFLFAYSGHGYSVKVRETIRGYLLTSSATSLTDPTNRLDLDVLRTMLSPVIDSAEKVLVLINSCDSGAFLGRKAFGPNPLGPGEEGAHAIMASRSRQPSLQLDSVGPGSVFFEKILAGLGGPADNAPADGVVTYHELDTYLHQEIPYVTNGDQNPVEGDISRNGSVGEFFFLNRSRQISFGNAPAWNPKDAVAFGAPAEEVLQKAREAYEAKGYAQAIGLFTQAAAAGNGDAMDYLGYMSQFGQGVTQDYQQARQWYEKGAAAGNAEAIYNLGTVFEHGQGVTQDYQQARQWYERAAAVGSPNAMVNLGSLYLYGHGVTRDYQQARQWYEKGAAAGSAEAMSGLGYLYENGLGVTQDYQQARQWYEKGAAAGSATAMYSLGDMYEHGHGVTQDYQQARQWYETAAAAGSADAMANLGSLYYYADGVTQNYQQARQWYEKGAAAGSAEAMSGLGYLYENGLGATQDYQQARQLFEKGAAAGSATAMYNLGAMYEHGVGVKQDYQQARQWYEKGAAAGNGDAMNNMGSLYYFGHGVPQDYQQARQWYEKGAAVGNATAMYDLGILYEHGQGVTQDYHQARQWYQRAAAAGYKDAQERIKSLPQ
jgi:hypothetical protein